MFVLADAGCARRFAVNNLSAHAQHQSRIFYITMSELSDHIVMLWVGVLFYIRWTDDEWDAEGNLKWSFSLLALVLVVMSRFVSVLAVGLLNRQIETEEGSTNAVSNKNLAMMIGAGLRGAVALALVMQMPSSSFVAISSATLFIIVVTNVVLGGLTTPLVMFLKIPFHVDLSKFEYSSQEKEDMWRSREWIEKWQGRFHVRVYEHEDEAEYKRWVSSHAMKWEKHIDEHAVAPEDEPPTGDRGKERVAKTYSNPLSGGEEAGEEAEDAEEYVEVSEEEEVADEGAEEAQADAEADDDANIDGVD